MVKKYKKGDILTVDILNNIGVIYKNRADFVNGLKYYNKSL